jgi:hypothetical protein
MSGLDPGMQTRELMDGRVKPGHDECVHGRT